MGEIFLFLRIVKVKKVGMGWGIRGWFRIWGMNVMIYFCVNVIFVFLEFIGEYGYL